MSLLTIIQSAHKRLGLNSPSTATASSDPQVIQFIALAQEEGIELMRRHPWSALITEKTFTGTLGASQTGAIPSDFDRFVDETFYNRTKKRPVDGPISPADWQFTQAVAASTLVEAFRVRGTSILLTPTPTSADTYAYEYITNKWCQSSGAVAQAAWVADADTGILDEELMTDGVVWRFLRAKGFDYAEAMRTYEIQVADKFLKDGGKPRLHMGKRTSHGQVRRPYIQEGNWSL